MELTRRSIVDGAVGPFDDYCDGYGNAGSSGVGYISALTLSTGKVEKKYDEVLEGIVSYDRAEANGAYIGQINMIAASSFCGLNGAVWGYDLARHEAIDSQEPMFTAEHFGEALPVYSVDPLLDAAERLFGTNEARRFPLLPGAHVICATKSATVAGPTTVWSTIALAIAADRDRDSSLFIEDCGHFEVTGETEVTEKLSTMLANVATSVALCGEDQGVRYERVFAGFRSEVIPDGYVGCALTCAPYLVLAKNAIPSGEPASSILDMPLEQWEAAVLRT